MKKEEEMYISDYRYRIRMPAVMEREKRRCRSPAIDIEAGCRW